MPRAWRRMLEEQTIPRLLARGGVPSAIHLKRFHSCGLGAAHVDQLCSAAVAARASMAVATDASRCGRVGCLRRYLQGLPVTERTDFERV